MKVTKREQVLLGVLLIALLGYGFYNFIYTKQHEKIIELKASRDTYSQKWEQVKAKIASKDKTSEQYKALNTEILNKTNMLFPSIEQEKIIVILDKMIKDSNLQAEVLGFSEVSNEDTPVDAGKTANNEDKSKATTNELDKLVSAFNADSNKTANSEKTNTSKAIASTNNPNSIGAYKMQVTLNFKGIYDELISFIKLVEAYDKKIIINNVNLAGAQASEVSGTLILDFYGIPKLNNTDYFKWDYKAPSGNKNPFLGSSSSLQVSNGVKTEEEATTVANNENTVAKDEIKSDFILRANPKTADLHTVTIQKAKDESELSYIYSDNAGIEQVEFYFEQVDDKYYYKYKTSTETYPEKFSDSIGFIPTGENINLSIFSQKRSLDSDLSGANIKIINATDKSVLANILDDDKNKPRITILKEKGDISVVRNYINYVDK